MAYQPFDWANAIKVAKQQGGPGGIAPRTVNNPFAAPIQANPNNQIQIDGPGSVNPGQTTFDSTKPFDYSSAIAAAKKASETPFNPSQGYNYAPDISAVKKASETPFNPSQGYNYAADIAAAKNASATPFTTSQGYGSAAAGNRYIDGPGGTNQAAMLSAYTGQKYIDGPGGTKPQGQFSTANNSRYIDGPGGVNPQGQLSPANNSRYIDGPGGTKPQPQLSNSNRVRQIDGPVGTSPQGQFSNSNRSRYIDGPGGTNPASMLSAYTGQRQIDGPGGVNPQSQLSAQNNRRNIDGAGEYATANQAYQNAPAMQDFDMINQQYNSEPQVGLGGNVKTVNGDIYWSSNEEPDKWDKLGLRGQVNLPYKASKRPALQAAMDATYGSGWQNDFNGAVGDGSGSNTKVRKAYNDDLKNRAWETPQERSRREDYEFMAKQIRQSGGTPEPFVPNPIARTQGTGIGRYNPQGQTSAGNSGNSQGQVQPSTGYGGTGQGYSGTGQGSGGSYGGTSQGYSGGNQGSWASAGASQNADGTPLELFGDDISGKGPKSYSGLDPNINQALLKSLMPQLGNSIGNMGKNVDDYTRKASEMYDRSARNALEQYMPGVIERLSANGVLNSDTGKAALGDAMNQIANEAAGKSYEAGMTGAQMKYGIPGQLSPILGQARYSQSTNDLSPYSMLFSGIQNMM